MLCYSVKPEMSLMFKTLLVRNKSSEQPSRGVLTLKLHFGMGVLL